jgi:chemotaxis protein MotB
VAAVFLLVAASCETGRGSEAQDAENRNLLGVTEEQQARIDQLTNDRDALDRRVKELEAMVAKAGSATAAVEQAKGEISESVRQVLERFKGDNQVQVIRDGASYKFVVRESVLFKSGSTDLSDEGKRALARVADALKGGNQRINVEGHTDNVPVTQEETRKRYPRGNIDLSVGRAFAVYDYLMQEGGIDESRLSVSGYGAFRPIAPNTSETNKWQNRRVEIRVEDR